jgi:hypothetical protein
VTARQAVAWTPTIAAIPSPASANAGEPQLTVSSRGVLLSWIEHAGATTTLRFAERTPHGWTQPRTVASSHNEWTVNPIDVPSVLRLSNGTLVAQWLQRSGSGMHANDVRLSSSNDDGRTWSQPFTPYREGTPRERLFASLFELPNAGLGLIWLNGAETRSSMSNAPGRDSGHVQGADHAHQPPAGHQGHERHAERGSAGAMGDMTLRFAAFDSAWQPMADSVIDPRVCECCATAAVVTSEGVVAAYRNRSDDDIRDIYVARLIDGRWTEPSSVHADNWRVPACPINGPALSASGRNVIAAWYTVEQDQGHAYVAFSSDAGRTFSEPTRLDDTMSLGRVDVELLPDGSAVATWIEVAEGRSQFRARRVTKQGTRSPAVTIAGLAGARAGGAPRLARHEDEVVFAWIETSDSISRVRTASASLPTSALR